MLLENCLEGRDDSFYATRAGNQLGVTCTDRGEMHILVNRYRSTVLANDIPTDCPLWALVDLYGVTKQVSFLSYTSSDVHSLRDLCHFVAVDCLSCRGDTEKLPLPNSVKAELVASISANARLEEALLGNAKLVASLSAKAEFEESSSANSQLEEYAEMEASAALSAKAEMKAYLSSLSSARRKHGRKNWFFWK